MNERIRELLLQNRNSFTNGVTDTNGGVYIHGSQENLEKFAELILIEVTDILSIYRGKMVFEDGAEYNHEHPIIAIKKHFGIES